MLETDDSCDIRVGGLDRRFRLERLDSTRACCCAEAYGKVSLVGYTKLDPYEPEEVEKCRAAIRREIGCARDEDPEVVAENYVILTVWLNPILPESGKRRQKKKNKNLVRAFGSHNGVQLTKVPAMRLGSTTLNKGRTNLTIR